VFRTLGVAAITLVAGIGLGLAKDAGAEPAQPAITVGTKTPVSCLLALESAWKTMNPIPGDATDHKAAFDAEYAECLAAS
jgi:hypothetical protein